MKFASLLFIPMLFFLGCTSYTSSQFNESDTSVNILHSAFINDTLTVSVGSTVTWFNSDNIAHTATADDGSFDSGVLGRGESFSFTFSEPGEFEYICTLHPYMKGKIIVVE